MVEQLETYTFVKTCVQSKQIEQVLLYMRKQMLSLITLLTFSVCLWAQPQQAPEQSDPAAKKVLDKIRKKYDAYKTIDAAFSLTIEVPGQAKDVQKGAIAQDGKKFRLEMSDQTVVSDGVTTWAYQKKSNEVQINDADPKDANSLMSPKELLSRYQKGDFLYAISDKVTEAGKILTMIEFKPKDRNSEYSKLRIAIDEKAGVIQSVKGFAKDGSRYTFVITRITPNKSLPAAQFTFDAKQYKGIRVEDLRL
jgi:outer membrane lipoprotein carrier protein